MKKITLILLLIFNVAFCFAQEHNVMFVYRNDGDFNAFETSEIDSITYSEYGQDSILYDDVEVQVIWTHDSVYRIPVSVIDSISYNEPETKYKSNVILMNSNWLQHIINVNEMTIIFDNEITQLWTPHEGDILLYEHFDEIFPNGFCGRVASHVYDSTCTIFCDSVLDINEVYETIIIFGTYDVVEVSKENGIKEHKLVKHQKGNNTSSHNLTISIPVNDNITISGTLELTFTPTLYKDGDDFKKFELRIKDTEVFNINASFPKDFIDKKLGEELKLSVPIPNTPLKILTTIAPFMEANLHASLEGNASVVVGGAQTISLTTSGIDRKTTPRSGSVSYGFSGGLSGELGFGIVPAIGVSMVGDFISEKINLDISTGLSCELTLFEGVWDSKEGYNMNKDITLNWYAAMEVELETQIKVFGYKYTHSDKLGEARTNIKTWYFVPEFTDPQCNVNGFKANVSTLIQRSLIIPVRYGIKLLDEDNNIVDIYTAQSTYTGSSGKANKITKEYKDLDYGKTYTVIPYFILFNSEIEDEHIKSFTIDPEEYDLHVQVYVNNIYNEYYGAYILDTIIAAYNECKSCSEMKELDIYRTIHDVHFGNYSYSYVIKYSKNTLVEYVTDFFTQTKDYAHLVIQMSGGRIDYYSGLESYSYASDNLCNDWMCQSFGMKSVHGSVSNISDCRFKVKIQCVEKRKNKKNK